MSNGRNANHVTLPAVCRPFRFSIAATCSRFPSSTFAELAIMLAICFRLPAVGLFTLYFITAPSSLFQRQMDGQMILWQYITQADYQRYRYLQDGAVWHVQPITLDMDSMRGHCNGTRYVVRQISRRYFACSQQSRLCAVHSADTAVAYVFTHRCTWRHRDA